MKTLFASYVKHKSNGRKENKALIIDNMITIYRHPWDALLCFRSIWVTFLKRCWGFVYVTRTQRFSSEGYIQPLGGASQEVEDFLWSTTLKWRRIMQCFFLEEKVFRNLRFGFHLDWQQSKLYPEFCWPSWTPWEFQQASCEGKLSPQNSCLLDAVKLHTKHLNKPISQSTKICVGYLRAFFFFLGGGPCKYPQIHSKSFSSW